ncbi:hypothetical protein DICVIV_00378 [Dictyocaulus viviparus]|uniref:W02B3.4-like N-terminal domain-containing protein n=1 Tax=Dictyocaulus viviparus TaxID=29172 RepID=A0A0D8Y9L8_DICVI|nr:hypothetical protein DICVIV_00378 [Dictyocaulus viviparus]
MQKSTSAEVQNYSEHIIHYENIPQKNYLLFYDSPTRIIPRISFQIHGNLSIPSDIGRFFEFWKRSILMHCRSLTVVRSEQTRYLPLEKTLEAMSSFMSYLIEFDIYPILFGGTLLGWYRECDIIPHTTDIDFAALIKEHNPALLEHLLSNETKFRLTRKLGQINDSYEFTLRPLDGGHPTIDLFWMYTVGNESWVGGTGGNGAKYKYTYPRYNHTCAADLLGHIFWVTCSPGQTVVHTCVIAKYRHDAGLL